MVMASEREHLSLVVAGHLDAGKTTTWGNLILKQGGFSAREYQKFVVPKVFDRGYFTMNYDFTKDERERGTTISSKQNHFYTERYHYTIVDVPGHGDYIKNMIRGSAAADAGLLLVSAERFGLEAATAKADPKRGVKEGQARLHARLLHLLGVERIVVGVNKMDACGWSEDRFNEIKDELVGMLKQTGHKPKKIPFVPFSGLRGDNLVERSGVAAWYKGWTANLGPKRKVTGYTILDALDDFCCPRKRIPDAPLRLAISNHYHKVKGVGRVSVGTVLQGTIRRGDAIGLAPSGLTRKKVFSMEQHRQHTDCFEVAGPGDYIGITIMGLSKVEKIKAGDIIYRSEEGPLVPVKNFTAMVAVQEHAGVLRPGYSPVIFCCTAKAVCKMTKILWKQSNTTEGARIEDPTELSQLETAEVEFEPTTPIFLETFEQCASLGRIVVMDSNTLKMIGKVINVCSKDS